MVEEEAVAKTEEEDYLHAIEHRLRAVLQKQDTDFRYRLSSPGGVVQLFLSDPDFNGVSGPTVRAILEEFKAELFWVSGSRKGIVLQLGPRGASHWRVS